MQKLTKESRISNLPSALKRPKDKKQPIKPPSRKQLPIKKRARSTTLRRSKTRKTMKKKLKNTVVRRSRKITTIKKRIKLLLKVNQEEVTTGVVAEVIVAIALCTSNVLNVLTEVAILTGEVATAEVAAIGAVPELPQTRMTKDSLLKPETKSRRIAAIVADIAATGKAVVVAIVAIAVIAGTVVIAEAEAKVVVPIVAVRVEPRQSKTRLNQPSPLRRPSPKVNSEVEARFV